MPLLGMPGVAIGRMVARPAIAHDREGYGAGAGRQLREVGLEGVGDARLWQVASTALAIAIGCVAYPPGVQPSPGEAPGLRDGWVRSMLLEILIATVGGFSWCCLHAMRFPSQNS